MSIKQEKSESFKILSESWKKQSKDDNLDTTEEMNNEILSSLGEALDSFQPNYEILNPIYYENPYHTITFGKTTFEEEEKILLKRIKHFVNDIMEGNQVCFYSVLFMFDESHYFTYFKRQLNKHAKKYGKYALAIEKIDLNNSVISLSINFIDSYDVNMNEEGLKIY